MPPPLLVSSIVRRRMTRGALRFILGSAGGRAPPKLAANAIESAYEPCTRRASHAGEDCVEAVRAAFACRVSGADERPKPVERADWPIGGWPAGTLRDASTTSSRSIKEPTLIWFLTFSCRRPTEIRRQCWVNTLSAQVLCNFK
ncbi:hypothetical protein PT2222_80343 [Paraburkholderia tropica]